MSDLPQRLRGIYQVGENAEFGVRNFSSSIYIPPIAYEAADRIELLEKTIKELFSVLQEWEPDNSKGEHLKVWGKALRVIDES